MPIIGDLRQLSLPKLLELLAAGGKAGRLTITTRGSVVEAYLRPGFLQQASLASGPSPVEALLTSRASPDEREGLKRLTHGGDLGSLLLLDFFGVAPREEALGALREQALAALQRAMGWQKADFRFEAGSMAPAGTLDVGMALAPVSRRLAQESAAGGSATHQSGR